MKKPVSKTPLVKLIQLLVRGAAPSAAITFGLSPATTLSAPGDLDPSFADFGRVGPVMDLTGPAWSVQAVGTDQTLISGGAHCDFYCYFYGPEDFSSFSAEFSGDGTRYSAFAADELHSTEVFDSAVLPDGSIIAVGRSGRNDQLTVAKLSSSGALDKSFGNAGVFTLGTQPHRHMATSVVIDPDGRIVVAGPQTSPAALIVVRLHTNGVIDESFGHAGIYTGPQADYVLGGIKIVGTGGGYRVTNSDCTVIGLTAAGILDTTFGNAGTANPHPGQSLFCSSLVAQPDGRLLVAGSDGSHSYAARLLATGAADPSFSSGAIVAGIGNATAAAVAGDSSGFIVVAGTDPAGSSDAVLMRLQADGQLDPTFGRAGRTLVDLPSDYGTFPGIRDVVFHTDGSVTATGGAYSNSLSDHPFLVRLLGTGGADVPGVIGTSQSNASVDEQSNEVVVKVQRTGGSAGTVSVDYATKSVDVNSSPATPGKDFTAVSGRLTWNDGDIAEQEIHVPILADTVTEDSELFLVQLSNPAGGAGLGTRNSTVEIQPDGKPYGLFSVTVDTPNQDEGVPAQLEVSRDYYVSGAVSVTLTPVAGTASAGADFDPTPVTVSWADGEGGPKVVMINLPADNMAESSETFSVKLSNPTGGALVGPRSTGEVSINASASSGGSSGGGGSFGALGLLILAAAKLLQSVWTAIRRRLPYGA